MYRIFSFKGHLSDCHSFAQTRVQSSRFYCPSISTNRRVELCASGPGLDALASPTAPERAASSAPQPVSPTRYPCDVVKHSKRRLCVRRSVRLHTQSTPASSPSRWRKRGIAIGPGVPCGPRGRHCPKATGAPMPSLADLFCLFSDFRGGSVTQRVLRARFLRRRSVLRGNASPSRVHQLMDIRFVSGLGLSRR